MSYDNVDTRLKYEAEQQHNQQQQMQQTQPRTMVVPQQGAMPNILNPAPFSSVISVNNAMSWGLQRQPSAPPPVPVPSEQHSTSYEDIMLKQRLLPLPETYEQVSTGMVPTVPSLPVVVPARRDGDDEWSRRAADIALGRVSKPVRSELQVYNCDICGKRFSRRMNLKSHKNSSHAKQKPYQCTYCTQRFARFSDKKRHETIMHSETGVIYRCFGVDDNGNTWGCNRTFRRKDGLAAHWKSKKAKTRCLKDVIDKRQRELLLNPPSSQQ